VRIIGGQYKGMVLRPPKGLPVRPTTDRAKESLFNILNNETDWSNTSVLELFTGTGNIALEALSRGAKSLCVVDQHPSCIKFIRNTVSKFQYSDIQYFCMDVLKWLTKNTQRFDLIFLDPPYSMPGQEALIEKLQRDTLTDDGLLVLEHLSQKDFSRITGFREVRTYGQSAFSFFTKPITL